MQFYLFVGAFVTVFSGMLAFPSGPPTNVCQSMSPARHFDLGAEDANRNYDLVTQDTTFNPGDTVGMRITGPQAYRGLFLQVRNSADITNSVAVGSWGVPSGYRHIDCEDFDPGSALGQNSRAEKNTVAQEFLWTAPDSCEDGQEFTARATVVQTFDEIQMGITLTLTCRSLPPPPPPARTTTVPPPVITNPPPRTTTTPQPIIIFPPPSVATPGPPLIPPISLPGVVLPPPVQCSFTDLNSISSGYNNNFEDPNNVLQSWEAIGDNFRWIRNSGLTPSMLTGPSSSDEGNYYVFSEASSPAQPGQEAILQTAANLRGCFCLRFSHSQLVMGESHVFTVEIGGNVVATINQRTTQQWVERSFQVDVPTFVRIRLIARRGTNWLGDIALDNVRITQGVC